MGKDFFGEEGILLLFFGFFLLNIHIVFYYIKINALQQNIYVHLLFIFCCCCNFVIFVSRYGESNKDFYFHSFGSQGMTIISFLY